MPLNVLIVGSGGREHALAWKLSRSPRLGELHAAPGNPGIATLGTCHPVRQEDAEGVLELARAIDADLVVVGPEAPLVAGLADHLRRAGVPVFGPSAAAARIEGSKSFAKEIMAAAGVPTAGPATAAPCVVKADGLAAGKGVYICHTDAELTAGLAAARAFGGDVVVEELLEGPELSVLAVCDGSRAISLPAARDYSRAGDGDTGPNTGGMGCFSPVPGYGPDMLDELVESIHLPVLEALARRASPFIGVLYAGVMLTPAGPRVLEFNCRFGDPETQATLPLLDVDLLEALAAAAAGDAPGLALPADGRASVTVALTAGGYPAETDRGTPIEGVAEAEALGAVVFHAGTALRGSTLVTNGGRILNVTAVAASVEEARARAYAAAGKISFPGMRYRTDIAALA